MNEWYEVIEKDVNDEGVRVVAKLTKASVTRNFLLWEIEEQTFPNRKVTVRLKNWEGKKWHRVI